MKNKCVLHNKNIENNENKDKSIVEDTEKSVKDENKNGKNITEEMEREIEGDINNNNIDSSFSPYTVAIQDDFYYWDACGESDESGKLFLVDVDRRKIRDFESVTKNGDKISDASHINEKIGKKTDLASNLSPIPIQLFFDDNVERFRSHIIDVRTVSTFEPVPFTITENVFIKKVETFFAITDENYFIDLVLEMVEAQTEFVNKMH